MKFLILSWVIFSNVHGIHFFYNTQWMKRVYEHTKKQNKVSSNSDSFDMFLNKSYSIPECFQHLSWLL